MIKRTARKIFSPLTSLPIAQLYLHDLSGKRNVDQSYAGEVSKINQLLTDLNVTKGYAVDVAASDGLSQSCTYHLYKRDWSGMCVEMDPLKFSKMAFLYRNFSSVSLQKVRVTPSNVSSLLSSAECPVGFEFLNLDIDSYDLHVLRKIFEGGYKPKLISMEINEKIPSEVFFTVDFDEEHYWKGDHFYGCSLGAAANLMSEFDYELVDLEWNNAFFAPVSLIRKCNLTALSPHETYNIKYRNNYSRLSVFPWNKNVDNWQELSNAEAVLEINKFFSSYEGKFTCYEIK